jgi:hypothetical protein
MRFVRFNVAGDDLDEVAFAVGELRRQAKLPDEDDLVAIEIDRQDGDRRSGAQQVARFDISVRAARLHALVGTKSAPENLALDDHHVRGLIRDLNILRHLGSAHPLHTSDASASPLKADIARDLFMVGPPGQYLKRPREPAHGCLSIPE